MLTYGCKEGTIVSDMSVSNDTRASTRSASIRSARATPHVLFGKGLRVFNEPRGVSGSRDCPSSMRHAGHKITKFGITCGRSQQGTVLRPVKQPAQHTHVAGVTCVELRCLNPIHAAHQGCEVRPRLLCAECRPDKSKNCGSPVACLMPAVHQHASARHLVQDSKFRRQTIEPGLQEEE